MGSRLALIFRQWFEKFGQAWSACMFMMVEGDLTALSFYHAQVAAKTGSIAGLGFVIAAQFGAANNLWLSAWIIGIITMFADILVHPTHFGPAWMEAVCTGLGAALLCAVFDKVWRKKAG
jgi:hypothetical protein